MKGGKGQISPSKILPSNSLPWFGLRLNHNTDLNFKVIVVGSLNRGIIKIKLVVAEQKWFTNGRMVIAVNLFSNGCGHF